MAITLSKLTAGTRLLVNKANEILSKLEEIRMNHVNQSGFSSNPAAFNTSYNQQGTKVQQAFPTLIKNYITQLENSSYIDATFSSQVNVPEVGDLIKAVDQYNSYIDIVNALDAICANKSYNSVNSNFNNCGNNNYHANFVNFCGG